MSDVIQVRIPIEIVVRVGQPETSQRSDQASAATAPSNEKFHVDPDYARRKGFDTSWLGGTPVELPSITPEGMHDVSKDPDADDTVLSHVLRYHHFSIVMNRKRRLLFFAAYNTTRDPDVMGSSSRQQLGGGGGDKWILDPRIPAAHQVTSKEFYGPTVFDRGHIVRREDAYWGADEEEAQLANFDSFHYTNCTPQHPAYNQSSRGGLWGQLENHIAKESSAKDLKLSVFAGPVLAKDDPVIEDVKVPRRFWKIVIARDDKKGTLGAWAFLLTQAKLVDAEKDRSEAVFDPGDFDAYQVPVSRIEELTEVRFDGAVHKADRHESTEEGPAGPRRLDGLGDIRI
jgi:endonuclease G